MCWNSEELDRVVDSTEVLPEDLQDYTVPMVIIGTDVVSLYPSLEIKVVCKRVMEAILLSEVKWQEVDYLEAVRYIALNLSAEECAKSGLRRVLLWRRKKMQLTTVVVSLHMKTGQSTFKAF